MLSNFPLELGVLVVSLDSLEIEVLSVIGDVGCELIQTGLESGLLGNEHVVNHVVSIEDIYDYIIYVGTSCGGVELLLESDDFSVVVVGSSCEVLDEIGQFRLEVGNELIDSVEEVLEGSL